jgi:DNA polymerase delta subunit 3
MLEDSLYLDNLQEFVQDESRIVTYKWLSRKLDVPTDAAKRMLYAYVEHCQSSSIPRPTVIYAVTGLIHSDKGKCHCVTLVREEELEDTKKNFISVRCVHIYSIQQARIKDSSTLFAADYDICKEHIATYSKWSPIGCPVPTKKPQPRPPSIATSHIDSQPQHKEAAATTEKNGGGCSDSGSKKASYKIPQLKGGREERGERQETKPKETASEVVEEQISGKDKAKPAQTKVAKPPQRKPEAKKKAVVKGSVTSFFNKQSTTVKKQLKQVPPPVDSSVSTTASTASLEKSETSKPQSSPTIVGEKNSSDVKSSPVKPASRTTPEVTKPVVQDAVKKTDRGWLKGLNDSDIDDGSDTEKDVVTVQKVTSRKEMTKKKGTQSTAKVTKVSELQKKRKRVQNMSSDEEENESTREERESEKKSVSSGKKKRKRVKRLKSKMYTTDDGAMVTEKVWESESTDESDTDARSHDTGGGAKSDTVKEKPEQCSPAKGTKQALLRNFFK